MKKGNKSKKQDKNALFKNKFFILLIITTSITITINLLLNSVEDWYISPLIIFLLPILIFSILSIIYFYISK